MFNLLSEITNGLGGTIGQRKLLDDLLATP